MISLYTLYQLDATKLKERIDEEGEGARVPHGWLSHDDAENIAVDYRARVNWANVQQLDLHSATTGLRHLLQEGLRRGKLHTNGDFHEILVSSQVLVLSPQKDAIVEYAKLSRGNNSGHKLRQSAKKANPFKKTKTQQWAGKVASDLGAVALADENVVVEVKDVLPDPKQVRNTEELYSLLGTAYVAGIAFDSAVLTWAGAAPGQSHTKLANEIRRSILAAADHGAITKGRDGTHEVQDDVWRVILDPTASKALFAMRQNPLPVETDDPNAVPTEELAALIDSDAVDNLVITPAILEQAGALNGQSLEDLEAELLDAVDIALEDGNLTPGFYGRHQMYAEGWLLVLSPSGTHMVTARRIN